MKAFSSEIMSSIHATSCGLSYFSIKDYHDVDEVQKMTIIQKLLPRYSFSSWKYDFYIFLRNNY